MIDRRASILISSIRKLSRRGALQNVQKILKKAHTPDIATLIEELEADERLTIFKMIASMDKRSDVISYLKPNTQVELLQSLEPKEANQIVQRMDSDDAADLLGRLPENMSEDILASMVKEESEDVADLMSYPEDSAGAIMSSDYLALNCNLSVSDAIKEIQSREEDSYTAIYIYVIDETNNLVGVLSVKDLILSRPNVALKDIMDPDIISVAIDLPPQDVAKVVERYDFLALPVVDSGKLVGIITVDDVIDIIREEAHEDLLAMGRAGWGGEETIAGHFKARFPWLLLTFGGGILCFFIFELIVPDDKRETWWALAGFIPLFLSLGSTAGNQSATVAVGAAKHGEFSFSGVTAHLLKEVQLGSIFSVLFGGFLFIWCRWLVGQANLSVLLGCSLGLQIILTVITGSLIPVLLQKLKLDPAFVSVPLFTILADISAISVLFGLYYYSSLAT
ncbi:MAG: magnesium transporter [Bdellovibrionales bacterium]